MFGVDVDGPQARPGGRHRRLDPRWPVESLRDIPPGDYFVQATLERLHHGQTADVTRSRCTWTRARGRTTGRRPGTSHHVEKVRIDPKAGGVVKIGSHGRTRPSSRRRDSKYVQTHQVPERPAQRVVGHGHLPGAGRPCCRKVGPSTRRAIPRHLQPRSLPAHVPRIRETPPTRRPGGPAAAAGGRAPSTRTGLPADGPRHRPSSSSTHAVLRRLVRGELANNGPYGDGCGRNSCLASRRSSAAFRGLVRA